MKQSNIPFDRAASSIVLVYSNGERYHVESGHVIDDLLNFNEALQVTTFAYMTGKAASHIKAKGVYVDTIKQETIIIDAVKSGLAFAVVAPCPACLDDQMVSAKVYTCAGIRSSVSGEDVSFIADALAFGL
uniref:Phage protein n=1 Tax=Salmonella phage PMBT26 TaxID=3229745 RepID=A0AB39C3Q1_9CAUD